MVFGIVAFSWLLVGFLVGLKAVYVDKVLRQENVNRLRKSADFDDQVVELATNKKIFITTTTLLGYIALIMDMAGTFRKGRK